MNDLFTTYTNNSYLEQFYKHKLLINITKASFEELKLLGSILDRRYTDGDGLEEALYRHNREYYLHCRSNGQDSLSYSSKPIDIFAYNRDMPFIDYRVILDEYNNIQLNEEEINNIYVAEK